MTAFRLADGATEIIFVRHGHAEPAETDALDNDDYALQGLSERGVTQARLAALYLKTMNVSAVYASPVLRARETAAIVAEACGLSVRDDDALREIAIGPVDAPDATTHAAAIRARLDVLAAIAMRDGSWSSIPQTEPGAEVRARMLAAAKRIAAAHPGQRVAAVSHAGAINALFAEAAGIERDFFFPAANASFSSLRIHDASMMIVSLNDTRCTSP